KSLSILMTAGSLCVAGCALADTVVVTTTTATADGNATNIQTLNAHPGADGLISFVEAVAATNGTPISGANPQNVISFALPLNAPTIRLPYTLFLTTPYTLVQGGPDVKITSVDDYLSFAVAADHCEVRDIALSNGLLDGAA